MGVPNRGEIRGKIHKAKGAAKETIGRAVGNRGMEKDGAAERRKGRAQESVGKVRRKLGNAIKDLVRTIHK